MVLRPPTHQSFIYFIRIGTLKNRWALPTISGWWFQPYPSEKYGFVHWDDDIPNLWKNKTCSKPPTSAAEMFFLVAF